MGIGRIRCFLTTAHLDDYDMGDGKELIGSGGGRGEALLALGVARWDKGGERNVNGSLVAALSSLVMESRPLAEF
jgi:hypothetical protein